MVAIRADEPVLAVKLQLMLPALVPLAPDVIENQLLPDITAAVQSMVPSHVFETPSVVVPDVLTTFWFEGVTERHGVGAPVTFMKLFLLSVSDPPEPVTARLTV